MQLLSKNHINKIRRLKYLNRGVVFLCDLVFSVSGTLLAYLYILAFFDGWNVNGVILPLIVSSAFVSILLFLTTGLYNVIIRHSTLKELPKVFYLLVGKEVVLFFIVYHLGVMPREFILLCAILDMFFTALLMIGARAFVVNVYYSIVNSDELHFSKIFIYSTLGRSPMLAEQINKNSAIPFRVAGFLTTNRAKEGMRISGARVYYIDRDDRRVEQLFKKKNVSHLVFTSEENLKQEQGRLVEFCMARHIQMFMAGDFYNLGDNPNYKNHIKPIQIEDLLDRDEIIIDTDKIASQVVGKVVLVTGAAGSIGSEIVMQLASFNVGRLVLLDNAETPLHNLQLQLREQFPKLAVEFCLGDVCSKERIRGVFEKYSPGMVFHAAAYKHVPMGEANPCEAVRVNVWGTINVARQATAHGVEKFVMISTDKAVNPTNVMGASKRIAEICVRHLNSGSTTQFITTRFGNVLGSNGSVIPLFKAQIEAGGPITVTHPDIIRYFMTIPEACRLVLQAAIMGCGGEIFVFDMGKQVRIADLARRMILLSGFEPEVDIKIEYTGLRPGEKLHEELLTDKEQTSATFHDKIRVAKSSDTYPPDEDIKQLLIAAVRIDVEKTVRLMKQVVPEFISNNSEFEIYDTKNKTK